MQLYTASDAVFFALKQCNVTKCDEFYRKQNKRFEKKTRRKLS